MRKTKKIINLSPLPLEFFSRPAKDVAPDLIGCLLVRRFSKNHLLWGAIVETEAYSESEASCHGSTRRTLSNETLFGEAGRLYIYLNYGIHHCVNVVTGKKDFAEGVLLRSIALPNENDRVAAGPGLLSRKFGLNKSHDNLLITGEHEVWIAPRLLEINNHKIVRTTRIGISKAVELQWRWYLQSSRSISKRMKGDHLPRKSKAWEPNSPDNP